MEILTRPTLALRRTILAENLQGIDYIYNLAGQLKAINDPDGNDPGNDGNNGVSADVFSMTLDYYTGDYNRANIHTVTEGKDQYNGNIKAMTWKTTGAVADGMETYYYDYNKNNWLASAGFSAPVDGSGTALTDVTRDATVTANEDVTATNSITLLPGFHVASGVTFTAKIDPNATGTISGDYNVTNLTYDQNGNLLSLNRNKDTQSGNNRMDELTYHYKPNLNQLDHVSDKVDEDGITTNADDIKTQTANNYSYNSIGQLVSNTEEGISYIYNASGLVTEVQKDNQPLVKFYYNDKGYRVRKESFTNGNLTSTDHYVRDASGNTLAIYNNSTLKEMPIYGASRLGVFYKQLDTPPVGEPEGAYVYQLTDHLGNVRAVIAKVSNNAAISSSTDYYPFGMPMPGRQTIGGELYRYAFQGQEKDLETGKEAFQLRLWDSRIGRWLSPDPYGQFHSPYLGMGNRPTIAVDPDGGFTCYLNDKPVPCEQIGESPIHDLPFSEFDVYQYSLPTVTLEYRRPDSKLTHSEFLAKMDYIEDFKRRRSESAAYMGNHPFFELALMGVTGGQSRTASLLNSGFKRTVWNTTKVQLKMANNRYAGKVGEFATNSRGGGYGRIPSHTNTANYRVPDKVTNFTIEETKNVKYLRLTNQLKDFAIEAEMRKKILIIHTRQNTKIAKKLQEKFDSGEILHEFIKGL